LKVHSELNSCLKKSIIEDSPSPDKSILEKKKTILKHSSDSKTYVESRKKVEKTELRNIISLKRVSFSPSNEIRLIHPRSSNLSLFRLEVPSGRTFGK